MEWRIAHLESEVYRLRTEIETMKWVARFERDQKRLSRAYWALFLVINAVLFGALSAGFGWI